MTVTFINRFFYPDHSATSRILSAVAFGLAGKGVKVRVICSRLRYEEPAGRLPPRETIRGVEVYRVATSRFGRLHLAGRAIDYFTFYVSAAWTLWRLSRRDDIVVAKTDPPMLSVVAAPIVWLRGARLVNWLQDVFPEIAQAVGIGRGRFARATYGLLESLRNRSLKNALNVVLGERMATRVAALGIPEEQIRVIPNFADGSVVRPITHDANALRAAWQLNDKFVVGYAGNFGRAHEHETMLAAMQLTDPSVAWLLVGGGAQLSQLKREAGAHGLANLRIEPYQPDERLAQCLSAADVHLVSLRPELEGLIVPSKFYGICAAGRPTIFIGDSDGEVARLIRRLECGYVVSPGDGHALAKAIKTLGEDRQLCARLGERARRAFEEEFDVPRAISRWQGLLQELAGQTGPGPAPSSRQGGVEAAAVAGGDP